MQSPIGITGLSSGSLVYLPIWKCAHSFFQTSLRNGFKWSPIEFQDIRWESQTVFAHILDPLERRHKGITEYICMHNLWDDLQRNNFREFIRHIPVLEEHSMSYHSLFGEYCWMIDWIPLTFEKTQVVDLTQKIMANHGQVLFDGKWSYQHENSADTNKKKICDTIKQLWDEKPIPNTYSRTYFQRDIKLFETVCEKFDQFGDAWNQISWLRDRHGHS